MSSPSSPLASKDSGSPPTSSKMPFSSPKRKRSEVMKNNSIHRALEGSPKSRHYDRQKQENNRNNKIAVMSFSAPSSSSSFMYDSDDNKNCNEGYLHDNASVTASSSSTTSKHRIPPSPLLKTRSGSVNQDDKIDKEFNDVNTKKSTHNNNDTERESKYIPNWSNTELVDKELGVDRPKSTMRTLFTDDPHDELLKESGILDDFIASSKPYDDDDDDDDDIVNEKNQWSLRGTSKYEGTSRSRTNRGAAENESFLESPIEFGKKLCFSPMKGAPSTKGLRKHQKYQHYLQDSEFIVPSAALRSSGDSIARLTSQTIPSSPDRIVSRDDDSWCPVCKTHSCIGAGAAVNCVHCQRSYAVRGRTFSTGSNDVSPVPRVGSPQHFDEMEYFPKCNGFRQNHSGLDIHDTSDDANLSDNSHILPVSDVSRGSDGIESSYDMTFTDLALNNSASSPVKSVQSSSSSSGCKSGMVLPDQSAFDTSRNSSDRYNNNSMMSPICPPTPHRTPTWAHDADDPDMHPLGLCRQNSLATSKILFSAQSSLEGGEDDYHEISFARNFEDQGVIGSGQFSDVYLVKERGGMKNRYAVKKSRSQFKGKKDRDLIMKEVELMSLLGNSCANIIQLVRAWQESGFLYVQIDFAERGTLKDLLYDLSQENRRFPDTTVWKIAGDVANGLSHIHSCGLVHLDIKPANILINYDGVLKIGDFGMATMQGVGEDGKEGDNRYMAPEVLRNEHRSPADIFSLALTLYEICLVPPLHILPSEGEKWQDLRSGGASALPDRPHTLNNIILKCMAPVPIDRPSTEEILVEKEIVQVSTTVDATLLSAKVKQPASKKLSRTRSFRPIDGESSMSACSVDTSGSSIERCSSSELLRNKTPTNMEGVFAFDFVENNFSTSCNENEHRVEQEGKDGIESPVMGPSDNDVGFRNLIEGTMKSSDQRRRNKSRASKTKKAIDFSSPYGVNNDWSTEISTEINSDQCHNISTE